MKKENFFLKGILVLALVFGVFLTGCENDNSPTIVAVTPGLSGPVVTAKAVNAGVLLTWPAVIETSSYQVWRTSSGQASPIKIGTINDATGNQTAGVVTYLDAVDATKEHSLRSNTEYIYSVVAVPAAAAKDSGRTNVTVRTGTLLGAGAKAAQPVDADLAIDFGTGNVTVTITPPTSGNIPNAYVFTLPGSSTSTAVYYDGSAASLTYTVALTQASLLYYYIGNLSVSIIGSLGNSTYYQASDPFTLKKTVEPLFSGSIEITNFYTYTSNSSYAVTKFGAKIDLDGITPKPGVTYTLERAKQTNNPAANWVWTTPTLYSNTGSSATVITNLTQDIFGNFPAFGVNSGTTYSSIVYDQNIPFDEAEGIWIYRLKAERDGITDYKQDNIEIDFWKILLSPAGGEFEIKMPEAANYTDGTSRYKFQPYFDPDYQNLLKDGDKVVVYWVTGGRYSYQYGAFSTTNSITFTKQDLTGYTTYAKEAKTLSVPRSAGTNTFLYVQIYLESPNRESQVISSYLSDDNDWVYSDLYNWQNGQQSRRLAY